MFVDKAKIYIKAGNGGDGAVAFHREKYVASGGPDGGDGGRGGNIVFQVDDNISTLADFRYKRKYKAQNGENGKGSRCNGKKAPDLIIKVPRGTVIREVESGVVMADMSSNEPFIAAKGGNGGWGNSHFATPTRQTPRFAKSGAPGEEWEVSLELKLIADVGLLGFPNVGKSSFLSVVSEAKPIIGDYHFTTIIPVLGVVSMGPENSFVIADIPGLIEGAHEGVGLGHDFLRHVERTKVLLHVLDVSGTDGRDPIEDFEKINFELSQYSERLGRRKQLVVANKMDLPEGQENFQRVKEYVEAKGYEIVKASAATGEGLQELMYKAYEMLQNFEPEPDEEENIIMDEIDPDSFEITACADADFEVKGKNIERLVAMTNFDNDEALYRFQLIWKSLGIDAALKEKGIQEGQTVRIRDMVFEFKEY